MAGADYALELYNVFYSGQLESASCLQTVFGTVQTGLILKDVSLEVKSGEVLAILGSKGSGKRALLEVIGRRCHGPTRGQILLDGASVTTSLFQRTCGYVATKSNLIPSLSVEQTLHYAASLSVGAQISSYLRNSRVRQVLADLALSQVARWSISKLNDSEYRRVQIGIQLVKDAMLLLLEEPTVDLDPLSTYLIVSMLSSHAKKRGRIVVLTMEKPRSDVFPFLDRVTYLCLGDVVYSGPTRLMLEYFKAIGFPCPQLENPLMYYLCLSTVDRRSRERFIESNTQIVALVEKFKMEGGPYRKSSAMGSTNMLLLGSPERSSTLRKIPYASFGKPGAAKVGLFLYQRLFASTFCLTYEGALYFLLRLFSLPLVFAFLWFFYKNMQNYQWTFVSRNGLLFLSFMCAYFTAAFTTAYTFSIFRNAYYEESKAGLYSGPTFLFSYWLFSVPFSFLSTAAASYILFQVTGLRSADDWYAFAAILWGCYLLSEQQTIAIMMVVKSSFTSVVCSFYVSAITLILGTGALRSYQSLSEWLIYFTYACQTRYASAFLNRQMFGDGRWHNLPSHEGGGNCAVSGYTSEHFTCRYLDGTAYLAERYGRDLGGFKTTDMFDPQFNMIVTFAFPLSLTLFNCLLYLVPLPAFVKNKFRE